MIQLKKYSMQYHGRVTQLQRAFILVTQSPNKANEM